MTRSNHPVCNAKQKQGHVTTDVSLSPCRRVGGPISAGRGSGWGRAQEEHTWVVKQVCLELLGTSHTHVILLPTTARCVPQTRNTGEPVETSRDCKGKLITER